MCNKLKNYLLAVEAVLTEKGHEVLAGTKGEAYVDSGVKILIAVVIGALLLAGLYWLFNNVIMPTTGNKVNELFNAADNVNIEGYVPA